MEKKYPWGKSKICVYVFLRYIKNVNLSFKKDFKFAELLTKTSFSLYFRDLPENGEGNKQETSKESAQK